MSKEGARTAKWALSLVVDTVILRNKPLKEHYTSEKKRKGSGSFAHVLTTRKLLRMILVMLKDRTKWKYDITSITEDKTSGFVGIEQFGHTDQQNFMDGLLMH